jgi:hypothetical protein
VHKLETIDVIALDGAFLDEVDSHLGERGGELEVTVSDGLLYVAVGGETLTTSVAPMRLA